MSYVKKLILRATLGTGAFLGASVSASADEVTVQAGDTLSEIAQNNNTTVDHLADVNHLGDVNMIFVNQKIETGETKADQSDTSKVAESTTTPTSSSSQSQNTQATTTGQTQQSQQSQAAVVTQSTNGASASEETMLAAVNAYRAAARLAPLSYDARLASRATGRAADAVNNGYLPTGHMQQVARPEVVAIDWSPSQVVSAWYNETGMIAAPAHRNWILNPSITHVGFRMVGSTIVGLGS